MSLHLHIERVVLDGLTIPPAEHRLLLQAIEEGIRHLMSGEDVRRRLTDRAVAGRIAQLTARTIALDGSTIKPDRLGWQIAGSLIEGLGAAVGKPIGAWHSDVSAVGGETDAMHSISPGERS